MKIKPTNSTQKNVRAPKRTPKKTPKAAAITQGAKRGTKPTNKKTRISTPQVAEHIDFRRQTKSGLHSKNRHHGRYDLGQLVKVLPALAPHIVRTPAGEQSINFSDPLAVKLLNKAILLVDYGVQHWDIPNGFLCPPIPGRADYIHRVAELLDGERKGGFRHNAVHMLDIGAGANCIYPLVAAAEYGWNVVGSDIDPRSIDNAQAIVNANPQFQPRIVLRRQSKTDSIFKGIILPTDRFDITTCNPPFHRSAEEANAGTQRKIANLAANKVKRGSENLAKMRQNVASKPRNTSLNFGGQNAELWCPGGEAAFVAQMAIESRDFATQVLWFSTLISKKENVTPLCEQLSALGVKAMRVIEMSQGQKVSRLVAWSFLDAPLRRQWAELAGLKA
ncbi:23S rRNA (adenine(1618)-N(6))-methyltransferase RlmF [Vibrio sp. SM6]|uniref:Ribosomal RNA large subunit methyltransferase F n=1 Tax=Vibrio agarilyticus TaxID=2726741 RepID=A0A7X8TTM7_9VIBR|nr:23S rRNA (adenine(1618)-N(6))-methyltransferase RlmF [Vibrio agarilyticus]NLS14083.1 23S rRNA (adenine(1618)-N(6))-methyltransferase RlmF [Vibrio agarilyticus]